MELGVKEKEYTVYKPECGVKKSLFTEYQMEDHIWKDTVERNRKIGNVSLSTLFDDMLLLSNYIINVDGDIWMRTGGCMTWVMKKSQRDAVKDAKNCFMNRKLNGRLITSSMIDTFFSGTAAIPKNSEDGKKKDDFEVIEIGSIPQLYGTILIPYGPNFVIYKDQKYLNVWSNHRLSSNEKFRAEGKLILHLIYRSLCCGAMLSTDNATEIDLVEEMVLTGKYTNDNFKFVMHWLAATYQRPGINLLTNLWFVGLLEGIGKGTVVTVMNWLLGRGITAKFKQSEVEKGWTSPMANKVLIEIDELKTEDKLSIFNGAGFDNWLKVMSIGDEVTWSKRGTELPPTINVANYIITFNKAPSYMDQSNRRDTIIQTTNDRAWVAYAAAIQEKCVVNHPEDVSAGFGWYLERIEVDYALVNKAMMTEAKADRIDAEIGVTEEWVLYDETVIRNGSWTPATVLYEKFKDWCKERRPGLEMPTYRRFGIDIKGMFTRNIGGVFWKKDWNGTFVKFGENITTQAVDGAKALHDVSIALGKDDSSSELVKDFTESFKSKEISEFEKLSKLERVRRLLKRDFDDKELRDYSDEASE